MRQSLKDFDPRSRLLEKVWNTYTHIPLHTTLDAAYWAAQPLGANHGPDKYVELQPSSRVLIEEVATRALGFQAPVLDLGCNVGRHLNALYQRGFRNIYGIDVQHAALEYMGKVFPEMQKIAHVQQGIFQQYLPIVEDRFFDIVFTHGATIELVPPTFPICQQMARVTKNFVILMISETGHSYPRLWETEFNRVGFALTKLLRPACPDASTSLLVFQPLISL